MMRIGGDTVGSRGLTVLAVVAAAGIGLGLHGWSGRHNGVAPGLAGSAQPGARATAPGASHGSHPGSSSPAPAPSSSSPASQGPVASSTRPSTHAPAGPGPKLSSQSYASYAFQVWPGPVSQAGKSAQIGLVIKVKKHGSGIEVAAGIAGQKLPAPKAYPTGAKVYVIEASLGDDSGADYNLGDDGLVVTDKQGRIVQ